MKYINEFRNAKIVGKIRKRIHELFNGYNDNITLMEVCGTHTTSIFRAGIRTLLPDNITLLSGPGCPVCVTPNEYMDRAIAYSRLDDVTITTFGDMIKVPGSTSSLEKEKGRGGDIRIVYSPMESLKIADDNPDRRVIFLGVGFETTSPLVASTIITSKKMGTDNYYVLSGHKLIPPAMIALLESGEVRIDGFICPGHVSTIIGSKPYRPISRKYNIPAVITGFEPVDILEGILMLLIQIIEKEKASVEIQYTRAVRREGNRKAVEILNRVFSIEDSEWRGLGIIPESGLNIRDDLSDFNALENIGVKVEETREHPECICGEILRGTQRPTKCSLFRKVCTPENPVGPCMVSSEGTCAAYYKYGMD